MKLSDEFALIGWVPVHPVSSAPTCSNARHIVTVVFLGMRNDRVLVFGCVGQDLLLFVLEMLDKDVNFLDLSFSFLLHEHLLLNVIFNLIFKVLDALLLDLRFVVLDAVGADVLIGRFWNDATA